MLRSSFVCLAALLLAGQATANPLPCGQDQASPRQAALVCLDDPMYENQALVALAWVGTPEDVSKIVPLLDEKSSLAVRALVGIGGDEAHAALVEAASRPESDVWEPAVEALGAVGGDQALAILTQHVGDPDAGGYAADGLARLGTDEAFEVVKRQFLAVQGDRAAWLYADSLRRFPKSSGAADVLWSAVEAGTWPQAPEALGMLARMQDTRVLPVLQEHLTSPFEDVRENAVSSLSEMPSADALPVLRAALPTCDAELAEEVAEAMLELDPSTRVELVQLVKTSDEDRAYAVAEAVWPYVGVHDLKEALEIAEARPGKVADRIRENLFIQSWVAGAIPELVLVEARKELDKHPDKVESNVLSVLVQGGVASDRDRLVALAQSGSTAWRELAIDALAEEPGAATDDLLLQWASDDNDDVRDAAMDAFDERAPAARHKVIDLLVKQRPERASSWGSREDWMMHSDAGREALVEQLRSGTGTERDAAIEAMLDTEQLEPFERLKGLASSLDEDGRERVVVALLGSDRAPADWIDSHLDDKNEDVATAAIEALVESAPPDAVPRLEKIARSKRLPEDVREAALDGLAELEPTDLEQILKRHVGKAPLSESALSLLVDHGTDSAASIVKEVARTHKKTETRVEAMDAFWGAGDAPFFIQFLDDPEEDVRDAAWSGLSRMESTRAATAAESRLNHEDTAKAVEAAEVLLNLGGAPAVRNDQRIRELAKEEPTLEWMLE